MTVSILLCDIIEEKGLHPDSEEAIFACLDCKHEDCVAEHVRRNRIDAPKIKTRKKIHRRRGFGDVSVPFPSYLFSQIAYHFRE